MLYGPRGLLAFEVKRAGRYGRGELTGLRALKADYPVARCHLLYGGDTPRTEDGIRVLPLRPALPQLAQILAPSQPSPVSARG